MLIAEMTSGIGRVDAKGVLSVLAGTGAKGFTGDGGMATAATFNGIHNFITGEWRSDACGFVQSRDPQD
jgi:hypothetical protein